MLVFGEAMTGQLIVFEGPDGVGKSTLASYLKGLLTDRGIKSELFSFPGDRPGTIGKLVYDIHHAPREFGIKEISPISLQALHIAAHLDAISRFILPVLRAGEWVVLDRFWWSTWVYGMVQNVEQRVLETLIQAERLLWGEVLPSVVFLLDQPLSFRPEQTDSGFTAIRSLYEELSHTQYDRHEIVALAQADQERARERISQWIGERSNTHGFDSSI